MRVAGEGREGRERPSEGTGEEACVSGLGMGAEVRTGGATNEENAHLLLPLGQPRWPRPGHCSPGTDGKGGTRDHRPGPGCRSALGLSVPGAAGPPLLPIPGRAAGIKQAAEPSASLSRGDSCWESL